MILLRGKDVDFRILGIWMENGLYGMYVPPSGYIFGHFYLYHFYFIFFPFYYLPFEISVYIWDSLRVISVFYVALNVYKITNNKKQVFLFLIFCAIGYAVDSFLNNSNWLILLLLFESYRQLQKEQKIFSGIFFTLATFKIIAIFFPFILLIVKRIKLKELIYYIVPFSILFLPYFINPPYFWQMYANWTVSDVEGSNLLLRFLYTILKVFEPAQLMFVSFGIFIISVNVEKDPWKDRFILIGFVVLTTMFVFYLVLMGSFTRVPT